MLLGGVPDALGAVDSVTGNALPWNPGISGGPIDEMVTDTNGTIYIGGEFTEIAGEYRPHLAAFARAAPPAFTAASAGGGSFQMQINGNPGQVYVVEASSNLLNWTPIATNTGTFNCMEPSGGASGFYRVVTSP
jgi:hypothetical protein